MEISDNKLIDSFLAGDPEAFSVLVKRYLGPIYGYSFHLTKNPDMANDITQDTFVKLWKNIKRWRSDGNFKTWLFSIAHNTAIDHLRKKKDVLFSELAVIGEDNYCEFDPADPSPIPEELFVKEEDLKLMNVALDRLPASQREVILLRLGEDITFDEIGKILGKPLNTVKSDYRRGVQKMKEIMHQKMV